MRRFTAQDGDRLLEGVQFKDGFIFVRCSDGTGATVFTNLDAFLVWDVQVEWID